MVRFRTWHAAFIVVAALLLVGVGALAGSAQNATPAVGTPCASPQASPAASGTPAATASPAAGCGPTVTMIDIKYDVKDIMIAAGQNATVNLVNKGSTPHNFNIDALNVHSGDYQAGQTGSVTINAKAGDYQYYCSIPGHKEAGMVGTLHVK